MKTKKILKIKEMLKDAKISKKVDKLGNIIFDVRNVSPSQYEFFYNNGFKECFDLVCIKCGLIECECLGSKIKSNKTDDKKEN